MIKILIQIRTRNKTCTTIHLTAYWILKVPITDVREQVPTVDCGNPHNQAQDYLKEKATS